MRVLVSDAAIVLVYRESSGYERPEHVTRLTIFRTRWHRRKRFTWEELQGLKSAAGYGKQQAVEIYPADRHIVNRVDMRHLWIMPFTLAFAWKLRKPE